MRILAGQNYRMIEVVTIGTGSLLIRPPLRSNLCALPQCQAATLNLTCASVVKNNA